MSGATQNPRGRKKKLQINAHPPSVRPLGQGRAEPQAQAWRGCCQLLKMQGTAPPGLVSLTLLQLHPNTLGTSVCTEHTDQLGVTSLARHSLLVTLCEMFFNTFTLFDQEGHTSSEKLLQYSAAGKEEKCNKFKFFASYHYIPISLSTAQLQQILNLTLLFPWWKKSSR